MWWIWLGVHRRRGAIVLVVFWRVCLGIVELWNSELVNAGEKHLCSSKLDEISLCNLVHFLQFTDVYLEVRYVCWDCGWVFGQLNII